MIDPKTFQGKPGGNRNKSVVTEKGGENTTEERLEEHAEADWADFGEVWIVALPVGGM